MNPPDNLADKLSTTLESLATTFFTNLKSVPNCTDELLATSLALFVLVYAKAAGPRFTPIATITAGMLAAEFRKNRDVKDN